MKIKRDLAEVHFLRGAASLMVCFFHLILGNGALFPSTNALEQTFSFGYLGVEIFFILSGYVICYSLPANFGYQHLKTFLLKRIIRIEPPYIVSIVLVIVLNFLSHSITGLSDDLDILVVLSHVAYINNFIPGSYLNVVYWTLGIEFQFYFLIALLFPMFKTSRYILLAVSVLFVAISCLHIPYKIDVIVPYLAYFTLGILLFFFKIKKQISLSAYLGLTFLCCVQLFFFQGVEGLVAAIVTVLLLHFWNYTNKLIRFFSMISYSLYLVHVPVGGKVINLGMRFTNSDISKYALVLLALAVSICFAYVFYRLIELPAINYSKRVSYKILADNGSKEENGRSVVLVPSKQDTEPSTLIKK
jgi:peptidoglycan/LPS O-acetylase OafA/YrhL